MDEQYPGYETYARHQSEGMRAMAHLAAYFICGFREGNAINDVVKQTWERDETGPSLYPTLSERALDSEWLLLSAMRGEDLDADETEELEELGKGVLELLEDNPNFSLTAPNAVSPKF